MRRLDGNRTQRRSGRHAVRHIFRLLALCAVLSIGLLWQGAAPAMAQGRPPLVRPLIMVSLSGGPIFDPLVEAITSHGGETHALTITHEDSFNSLRRFCQNDGDASPDIVLAIHRLHSALAAECLANGVEDIAEVELGRSAMILAVRSGSMLTGLTSRQVYLAIAREVPYRDELVRNTAVRWSDVDPALPPQDIRFELPLRSEGSRAIFDSLVLEGGCRGEKAVKQIFSARQRTARCITARSDRVREIARGQAARALLDAPIGTVGVVSQLDIEKSGGLLVGLALDDVAPTQDAILSGAYDYSTSFWLYAKRNQATHGGTPALDALVEHLIEHSQSEEIVGPNGPLQSVGLVPLPPDERAAQRAALAARHGFFSLASVTGWLTSFGSDAWAMLGPRYALPPEDTRRATDFTTLMDIAGYRVTDINSSIGIIPDAGMTFSISREMSDSDQNYLERELYRDSLRRPGAISALQRRIVRSIIGVRDVGGFEVSKVEIVFLPLPKVALTVSPKDVLAANAATNRVADDAQ
jgi:phosphate transport system substrate-binding protein